MTLQPTNPPFPIRLPMVDEQPAALTPPVTRHVLLEERDAEYIEQTLSSLTPYLARIHADAYEEEQAEINEAWDCVRSAIGMLANAPRTEMIGKPLAALLPAAKGGA